MNWIRKHFKQIIYVSFLFPIILVAFVSISHVTTWYGLANPLSWAVYLSVAVEVAALSSLAAIVAKMGKRVYIPFGIVTLIQLIGNIFFSYQFIDINAQVFRDWVELSSPIMSYLGVEPTDFIGHKRILSFLTGGLLPIISLTFLGLLVKFEEDDWDINKENITGETLREIDETTLLEDEETSTENTINASDIIGEVSKIRLDDDDLNKLDAYVTKMKPLSSKDDIPTEISTNLETPETENKFYMETIDGDLVVSEEDAEKYMQQITSPTPGETPPATPSPTPSETPSPTPSVTPSPTVKKTNIISYIDDDGVGEEKGIEGVEGKNEDEIKKKY